MFYRLRHNFAAIPLSAESLLFRSDTRSLKVEGAFADILCSQLLPKLDGRTALEGIAQALNLPVPVLRENLDALVQSGIFESSPTALDQATDDPRLQLAGSLATDAREVRTRLDKAKIVIFGIEGLGELVAEQLLAAGFQNLLLVDPFGAEAPADERLRQRFAGRSVTLSGADRLDRQSVAELARGSDLLIACWDKGYDSGNHWVNRASIELNLPALFCSLGGVQAFAGPFVVPGMTACYMCSRMRAIATSDNFEEAMACERYFDNLKQPGFAHREFFVSSLSILACLLATDAYKYIVLQYQPSLLGQIIEFDPITLDLKRHALLEQPQCPVCSKKKISHVIIPAWRNSAPPNPPPASPSTH